MPAGGFHHVQGLVVVHGEGLFHQGGDARFEGDECSLAVQGMRGGHVHDIEFGAAGDGLVGTVGVLRAESVGKSAGPGEVGGSHGVQARVGQPAQVFGKLVRYFAQTDNTPVENALFHGSFNV